MASNTVRLHRVLRAPAERIYRAFLDPAAYAKWLPPNGFTCTVHQLDARVGGTYRASFTNFSTGSSHSFGGKYLELVPNERIRHDDQFEDPNLPGTMIATITFKPVLVGPKSTSSRRAFPTRSPSRPATSAGRNRWCCWASWSKPRSRTELTGFFGEMTPALCLDGLSARRRHARPPGAHGRARPS
jgi:uncharacterized protein YndB with AHSA1/START domain